MKRFVFDRLVDRENICNLEREQRELRKAVRNGTSVVVYGPRNYGKTSVVRNIIIDEFERARRRRFVLFVDLLGIRSLESLNERMTAGLQRSFAASFPVKGLLENARRFLGSLRPEVSLDAHTGSPSVSLHADDGTSSLSIRYLWEHVAGIAREVPSLIVLDEFQDIAFAEEAPAQMRAGLELIHDTPVLILGSKRHILADLFAKPNAPLNGWGTDLEFEPIPYADYHAYIQERFADRTLRISLEASTQLQNDMQRVPEAVNRLCAQVMELYKDTEIDRVKVLTAVERLLENREGRYSAYLSSFSVTEERVLLEIARIGSIEQPQAKGFVSRVGLSSRAAGLTVKRLWDRGILEKAAGGYRIADPLLAEYLRLYR